MISQAAAVSPPSSQVALPLARGGAPGAGAGVFVGAGRRVASVDALRALVMFTMLFVNDVAGVRGAPWWMKHYFPYDASGMTFVDLVFPAFLFLVGMSIPLALHHRLERGQSWTEIAWHILLRALGLLLIGVFMVNMPADAISMGWPDGLWDVLALSAVLLAFHSVPANVPGARWASRGARLAGFAGLAVLASVYQGKEGGPMHTSWYGILGLIGWAYLVAALLYLPLRRSRGLMLLAAAGLLGVWVADHHQAFDGLAIRSWVNGSELGSQPAITLAGAALGGTLVGAGAIASTRRRFGFAALLAAGSAAGALLLHRAYGINKNAATPSWCLWSICIGTVLWMLLHATMDLRKSPPRWASLLTLAGANALLAYILSGYFARLLACWGVEFYWQLGARSVAVGITRSLLFATVMLATAGLLARRRIRLQV